MATFQNRASLNYNGNAILSNLVTGEILADLTVTKTPVTAAYGTEDAPAYVITLVNSGTTSYTGLTLTDDLGAYTVPGGTASVVPLTYRANSATYYVNGALQTAPTVTAGPPLVIQGISVPAGGNATVVYRADTNGFTPLASGSAITNTVSVTGGGLTEPLTAAATANVTAAPALSIEKALSPAVVTDNGQITYTLTVRNTGNTAITAEDGVTITDTFDPVLSDITVTYNGTPWTAPTNYTYSGTSGLFSSVAGAITVPAATYTQDTTTGVVTVTPGTAVIVITGTI